MPIRRNLLERIIKEEYEKLLNEFVVPVGFSLSKWKQHRKKHNITNAEYHKEHPETKWKVVHGHKEGHIGEPLKGMENMSYQKATKAHAAIAMNEFVEPSTTDTQQTQNPYKISRKSTTAGQLAKVQRDQLKAAFGKEGQELSGLERTLIKDLEEKIRELASIPDVDLVKIRPRIEQMLKIFYKSFDPQIKASQSQKSEPAPDATKPAPQNKAQTTPGSKPLTLE
jgi:hypothetical protein